MGNPGRKQPPEKNAGLSRVDGPTVRRRAHFGRIGRNESYYPVFKVLEKSAGIQRKRSQAPRHYFLGRAADGRAREWFGINFVTISAPGVGVCSI
jgi:hypothetical protein